MLVLPNAGLKREMHRHRNAKLLLIASLMLGYGVADAAQWHVQPRLQVAETYTDNIALAPPGREKTEYVTQVNPGISLKGEGRRVKVNLDYRLQNAIYATDGNRNSSNNQLAAKANVELLRDLFFVDARSSISQQIVNADGRVPLDNLNTGNYENVFTYGVSPYLKLRLASYMQGEVRMSADRVENQSNSISDARSQKYSAHFNSGSRFTRFRWGAQYYQEDLHQQALGDSHYQNASADVRYGLFSSWNLLAHGGYEDNNIVTVNNPHNGSYWSAGLEWAPSRRLAVSATKGENNWDANLSFQPNERTSLHVGYRDRKVGLVRGPSWDVMLSHRTRRTVWQGSYTEESTTTQSLQLTGQQFFNLVDSQGNVIVNPNTGLPVILVRNVFSLTDQTFIRKRGQLSVTLTTGKSDVVFSVFNEQRIYSLSNNSEDVVGPTLSWTWRFAPRTSAILGGGWQHRNPVNTKLHEDLWNGSIGLIHKISPNINASLEYSHLQRNTFVANGDYGENRVALQLNMRF